MPDGHGMRRKAAADSVGRTDAPRGTAGRTGRIDGPQDTEEHNDAPRSTASRNKSHRRSTEHGELLLVATTHCGILRVVTTYPSVTAYYSGLAYCFGVRRGAEGNDGFRRTSSDRGDTAQQKNPARTVILRDSLRKIPVIGIQRRGRDSNSWYGLPRTSV